MKFIEAFGVPCVRRHGRIVRKAKIFNVDNEFQTFEKIVPKSRIVKFCIEACFESLENRVLGIVPVK